MSARERELATAESELHAAEARLLVAKEETSVAESSLNSVRSSGDADDIARAKRLLDLSIDALATRQSEVSNLVTIVNELRALRVKESKVFTETTSETGSLIANARLAYPDISPKQEVVLATSTMMADFRKILLRGPLESRKIVEFRRRMDAILSTSTRWQFTSETGFVLDGPVTAEGQGASSILYAYSGPLLMCAKLGPRVFREHDVSEAVHRDFICPSVVHMTNKFLVARTARSEQPQQCVVMPLYPQSAADASLAFREQDRQSREHLAHAILVSGLAAVQAFSQAGWGHGDIKPSNLMLTNDGSGIVVLVDFGTAQPLGMDHMESSKFNCGATATASEHYDLVCLGSTVAHVLDPSAAPRDSLEDCLATLSKMAEVKQSPITDAALACLKGFESADTIAKTLQSGMRLRGSTWLPSLDSVWPRSRGAQ